MFRTILFLSLFLLAGLVSAHPVQAQVTPGDVGNFITTWDTENPGTTANNQLRIPGAAGVYNYDLYWQSLDDPSATGTVEDIAATSYTLTLPAPGRYRVEIAGAFPRINFNNGGDRQKILTVEQWGSIAWTSMQNAFRGASNLRIPAADAPNLSGVTSMAAMFREAVSFNDPIEHWNVSTITNMSEMFMYAEDFNQPLNGWNVSNVTNLASMFRVAQAFNQPLDQWDTSRVLSLQRLFYAFDQRGGFAFRDMAFNQNLNSWNTASVTDMFYTFGGVNDFNQPLNDWDVSNVTTMVGMFQFTSFNQPLDQWDTSSVLSMENMFQSAPFNQDISGWDTSAVTNMKQMFQCVTTLDRECVEHPFDQNLTAWDVTNVTDMTSMFQNARLSRNNLDATLVGWAAQTVQNDVPFHLGLKTYSSTGATALQTLVDTYNWDITEQYALTYTAGPNASLIGEGFQVVNAGEDGSEVEVRVDDGYNFLGWSDGATTTTRTDTNVTDNITVSALVEREGNGSSATRVGARKSGNEAPVQNTALSATLAQVQAITATPLPPIDPVRDRDVIIQLIAVLTELIRVLTELITRTA